MVAPSMFLRGCMRHPLVYRRTLAPSSSMLNGNQIKYYLHSQNKASDQIENPGSSHSRSSGSSHKSSNDSKHKSFCAIKFGAFIAGTSFSYFLYQRWKEMEGGKFLKQALCESTDQQTKTSPSAASFAVTANSSGNLPCPPSQKKLGTDRDKRGLISLATAIKRSQELCLMRKDEVGAPGVVVCVSVDGKQVYSEGFGYSDLENRIPIQANTVLRIASISKIITATIVAKLYEKNLLDLEKPVQYYVPEFPVKEWKGEKVEMKVWHLLCHSAGIRHYKFASDPACAFDKKIVKLLKEVSKASRGPFFLSGPQISSSLESSYKEEDNENQKEDEVAHVVMEATEMEREEYFSMKNYKTTLEALSMFDKDQLWAKPGERFVYTTFGYTLIAAIIERAAKTTYRNILTRTLKHMGLSETYLDENEPIIYNRGRSYVKNDKGKIVNAPYVDCSYKFAGGGIVSTVEDLIKFGNILLYSYQHQEGDPGLPGFLKSSTVQKFWSPVAKRGQLGHFGLGFALSPEKEHYGMCQKHEFGSYHTGAAVGASSVLYILPRKTSSPRQTNNPAATQNEQVVLVGDGKAGKKQGQKSLPQGVVVCIITNMISVSLADVAESIAKIFEDVDFDL